MSPRPMARASALVSSVASNRSPGRCPRYLLWPDDAVDGHASSSVSTGVSLLKFGISATIDRTVT